MMTTPASALSSAPVPPGPHPVIPGSKLKLGLLPAGVLVLLWVYVIYRLGTLWNSNKDYGFGWFVPLLCLALFWERWQRRPARSPVQPAGGTFFLLGFFGLALFAAILFLEIIPTWRFAGWLFAGAAVGITFIILYFLGGRSWSRYFAFPVIFFLIAVPWPTRVEGPLIENMSKLNAATSAATANALGTPAVRRGVLIETTSGLVGVDDACSGIRSFQSSVMVALFLGELFSFGLLRRGVLLLGAVGLAFACNVIRTTYLIRIADLHGLKAVNLHHDQAGFTILAITLSGLLVLVWLIRPRRRNQETELSQLMSGLDKLDELHNLAPDSQVAKSAAIPEPGVPDRMVSEIRSPVAVGSVSPFVIKAALAGLVLGIGLVEVGIYVWFRPAEKDATARANWTMNLPAKAVEYHESAPGETVRAMLSYDEGRRAEWRDNSGSVWQLFYFRWLPADNRYRAIMTLAQARGHSPDLCLKNAGMLLQTNLGTQFVSLNAVHLQVSNERFLDQGHTLNVFSCYWEPNLQRAPQPAPGTILAVRSVVQALKARDRGWNEKRVIKLAVWGKESDAAAQAAFLEYLSAMISK